MRDSSDRATAATRQSPPARWRLLRLSSRGALPPLQGAAGPRCSAASCQSVGERSISSRGLGAGWQTARTRPPRSPALYDLAAEQAQQQHSTAAQQQQQQQQQQHSGGGGCSKRRDSERSPPPKQ